jgi:L-lactate dehydrogenase complex protein LldG
MKQARDDIFTRLQESLARGPLDPATQNALRARLASPARGPQPAPVSDALAQFSDKVRAAAGSVTYAAGPASVVRAVQDFFTQNNIAPSLVVAAAPSLASLPWPRELHAQYRPLRTDDLTAITSAFAGVAETGSLVLLSGPLTPTRFNFLPDNYLCLLARHRIVPHMEDVWRLLREEYATLPRALNFITGPSRTADVEQIIQLGAHGPRRLLVVVTDDEGIAERGA